jgi:hypothetical protein
VLILEEVLFVAIQLFLVILCIQEDQEIKYGIPLGEA